MHVVVYPLKLDVDLVGWFGAQAASSPGAAVEHWQGPLSISWVPKLHQRRVWLAKQLLHAHL